MTFDDQLRRAFETLTAQLHDELSRQAQAVIDELANAAKAEREYALAAVRREHDAAQAERDQQLAEVDRERQAAHVELERRLAEVEVARQAAASAEPVATDAGSASAERLVSGIRAIDAARSLSAILDTLVACAGREVDAVAVALVGNGGHIGWRSIGFDPPAIRGESVELPDAARTIPLAVSGQTVAVLYSQPVDSSTTNAALEILARHAARCLESMTAFKAARAALVKTLDRADEISDDSTADDNAAARRYARLLVSEIKLYHEAEVLAGRRDRDLATRLGGEIARARVLYEQRVPVQIRQQTDYFQDELVRTLANGDSSLLQLT
jgi:hypothetical protein